MLSNVVNVILESPVWQALITEHANFAIGTGFLARRYPGVVTPWAAVKEQSEAAYEDLASIVLPGETVFTLSEAVPTPSKLWMMKMTFTIDQMVCEFSDALSTARNPAIQPLLDEAIAEMITLAKLTEPGPFEPRTKEMGRYLGIWQEGRLAAMAGERLHLSGFTEVSAVCTHPDFRGRGYARDLVAAVSQGIVERGETPFLHVRSDNVSAINVYQRLGFKKSRLVHFAMLLRAT